MRHVAKSVTGRHQFSDETGRSRRCNVTNSVTSLSTIYRSIDEGGAGEHETFRERMVNADVNKPCSTKNKSGSKSEPIAQFGAFVGVLTWGGLAERGVPFSLPKEFREGVSMNSKENKDSDRLFGIGINSKNRVDLILRSKSTTEFLSMMAAGWSSCDDTHHAQSELTARLLQARPLKFLEHLSPEDSSWFASLPSRIIIWRGCSAEKTNGLSWSTKRSIAESFMRGHRGCLVPRPLLLTCQIKKSEVLFATNERHECEVLWTPKVGGGRTATVVQVLS